MMIGAERTVEDEGKRVFYGMGQPMSLTLSFREIPWFDVQGEIQRFDWSEMHFSICPVWISRLWVILSQSRRCISTRTSNHGISPNDSVSESGCPLPVSVSGCRI
jgi:hypothetical protein